MSLNDTVVIDGEVNLLSQVDGDPNVLIVEGGGQSYPHYDGDYTVTPSTTAQVLETDGMVMDDDVTVQAVQEGSATTPATIITANPSISVSSGGLITATVSKTQQITPTVVEGYVETGTAGNVGVSGSNTQQLSTQGAQTLYPASTDQSIASGKYLTGNQTFKAVTVSGLTADKVLQGNVVKIGDADDDDRIMSVTGTASGGITPTGTKSITANGTGIDVYNYQYADVAVPNSYSSSDEGKVVSNGALVAQTSDTVTSNDTYDTTLINSLTVNVSGGGGYDLLDIVKRTEPSGAVVLDDTSNFNVRPYFFQSYTGITSFSSNKAKELQAYAFQNCSNMTSVNCSNCTKLEASVFEGCSKLASITLSQNYSVAQNAFRGLSSLVNFDFWGNGTANTLFYGCSNLEKVDCKNLNLYNFSVNTFQNCSKLNVLIIRKTSGVAGLAHTSAFTSTPFASGGTGGTLYVPNDLISSYQSASNWSTILGYANNSIQKIEGSIYE